MSSPAARNFCCHVVRRGFVLGRARHVRSLGQRAQVFFRQLGIGHGKKTGFGGVFGGGIAKAENWCEPQRKSCGMAADTDRQTRKQRKTTEQKYRMKRIS